MPHRDIEDETVPFVADEPREHRHQDDARPVSEFVGFFANVSTEEAEEHERWIKQRQAEKLEAERKSALKDWESAVPENLQATDFDDPRLKPYSAQISRVLGWKHTPKGIYAFGRSGRGKSRSIYALARRLAVDELVPVRFLLQNEITREINRDGVTGFLEKLDGLRRVPVLVWDDFGKFEAIGSRKGLLTAEIEALIDFRHSHGLPFLISTNAKKEDLYEIFGRMRGEPIGRRLNECCEVVNFGWE